MDDLFERLTALPLLIDPRQDQLRDVLVALQQLENFNTDNPTELIEMLNRVNLNRIANAYSSKCTDIRYGNRDLMNGINRISFKHCKRVIGAVNYV